MYEENISGTEKNKIHFVRMLGGNIFETSPAAFETFLKGGEPRGLTAGWIVVGVR